MDFANLLILQFIAHLLNDYFFQSEKKANEKNTYGFKSKFLKWHILGGFILAWGLSFQMNFVFGALVISLSHWLIDGVKQHFTKIIKLQKILFYLDQVLHLAIILVVVLIYHKYFEIQPLIVFNTKVLLIAAAYVICAKPTNVFIKEVFRSFEISYDKNNPDANSDLPNAGKLIGFVERWLILTLILFNHFEAISFLVAAKSILRYKNDELLKTEYVLIGTMLSFGIAIVLAFLIKLYI